jgi:hypothetical protein
MPRTVRICILLVLAAALLGVATASASPAHFHTNASPSGCDVCFVAHAAMVETPSLHLVYGPDIAGRTSILPPFFGYQTFSAQPHCSRGPPPCAL